MGKKSGKRARKRINQFAALKRWEMARDELPIPGSRFGDVKIGNNRLNRPTESEDFDDPNKSCILKARQPASKRNKSHLKVEENLETPWAHSWCLVELGQINQLCANAVCPSCLGETLKLKMGAAHANIGFSEPLILVCVNSRCNYSSDTVYSSPKMKESSQAYEVNSLMTKYANEIGGNTVLQTLQQFLKQEK